MSYGCEGCLISNQGQHELLSKVRTNAKKYAIENEKTVAIYKEGFEFFYIDEEKARELNYPVIEIVSKHQ
jgi:hypothetical protein